MKVLIVEDNPINAKILIAYLKSADYETVTAKSGSEAITRLEGDNAIMLIISDIMMPEMSGLELLRNIKSHPEWEDLPVIMCSAMSDLETVREAVKQGCNGYIVKPVQKEHVLRKVRDALKRSREILRDRKKNMRRLGLDEDDYADIETAFLEMVNGFVALTEKPDSETSSDELSVMLSNLRENAGYLGAERLVDVLEERGATDILDTGAFLRGPFGAKLLNELHRVKDVLFEHLQDHAIHRRTK